MKHFLIFACLLLQRTAASEQSYLQSVNQEVEFEESTTSIVYHHLRNGQSLGENGHRRLLLGGLVSGLLGFFGFGGKSVCPPEGFDAKTDFDFDSYISAPWFAAKQIPVSYQKYPDNFYCVRAEYIEDNTFCLFCNNKPRVVIDNQARNGAVDGEPQGSVSRFFRGIVRDPKRAPAKVSVGFFADVLQWNPNYWIVAAGTYDAILNGVESTGNIYEWAIVTGGPPSAEGENGKCKPNPGLLNFLGMWMFVRDFVPPVGVIEAVDNYASEKLGLDTTAWLPVAQEGCVFE